MKAHKRFRPLIFISVLLFMVATLGATGLAETAEGILKAEYELNEQSDADVSTVPSNWYEESVYLPEQVLREEARQYISTVYPYLPDGVIITDVKIGTGEGYVLASDGSLWTWRSTLYDVDSKGKVLTFDNVKQIVAWNHHFFALLEDGTVWSWGQNARGNLGNGMIGSWEWCNEAQRVQNLTNVIQIGDRVALKSDGTVWTWGHGAGGALGNGTIDIDAPTPVRVTGLTNVQAISYRRGLALKNDGTVWSWGYNDYGELGIPTDTYYQLTPKQVSGLSNITAISLFESHSMALTKTGTVYSWGYNRYGQLGNGTTTSNYKPTIISGLTNVKQIDSGEQHSVALKNDGTLWCWGISSVSGMNVSNNILTPTNNTYINGVNKISASMESTVAFTGDSVYVWGNNNRNQISAFSDSQPAYYTPALFAGGPKIFTIKVTEQRRESEEDVFVPIRVYDYNVAKGSRFHENYQIPDGYSVTTSAKSDVNIIIEDFNVIVTVEDINDHYYVYLRYTHSPVAATTCQVTIVEKWQDGTQEDIVREFDVELGDPFHETFEIPEGYEVSLVGVSVLDASSDDVVVDLINRTITIPSVEKNYRVELLYIPEGGLGTYHTVTIVEHYLDDALPDRAVDYRVEEGGTLIAEYEILNGYALQSSAMARMPFYWVNQADQTVTVMNVDQDLTITLNFYRNSYLVTVTQRFMDGSRDDIVEAYPVDMGDDFSEAFPAPDGYILAGASSNPLGVQVNYVDSTVLFRNVEQDMEILLIFIPG